MVKLAQAPNKRLCLFARQIMLDNLKNSAEHSADNHMAKLLVKDIGVIIIFAQKAHCGLNLNLAHIVNKTFILSAVAATNKNFENIVMVIHIIDHPLNAIYPLTVGAWNFEKALLRL